MVTGDQGLVTRGYGTSFTILALPLEGAVERSETGLAARLLKYGSPVSLSQENNACMLPLSAFARPLSVCKEDFSTSLEMTIRTERHPPLFFLFLSDTIEKTTFPLVLKGDRL